MISPVGHSKPCLAILSLAVAALPSVLPAHAETSYGTTIINGKKYELPPPTPDSPAGAALIAPFDPASNDTGAPPKLPTPSADPPAPEDGPLPQPNHYITAGQAVFAADEILVRFTANASHSVRMGILADFGLRAQFHLADIDAYLLQVPQDRDPRDIVASLSRNPNIAHAGLDYTGQASSWIPNDTYFSSGAQWALGAPGGGNHLDMPAAWGRGLGSANVWIGILDSGTDFYHPDLQPKIPWNPTSNNYYFFNEISSGVLPQEDPNLPTHGTAISGIAAAATNNGQGVAGVCPISPFLPVKVFQQQPIYPPYLPSLQTLENGIRDAYQVTNGLKVLNYSGDETNTDSTVEQSITNACNANALFVTSIGNSGDATTYFPAAYWNTMAVGASSIADTRESYSTYGPEISVVAPGGDIGNSVITTQIGSTYSGGTGTSVAAPHVSGLAALLVPTFPTMTWYDLKYRMEDTADDIDGVTYNGTPFRDIYTGWGRINGNKATSGTQILAYNLNTVGSYFGFSIPAWVNLPGNPIGRDYDLSTLFPGANPTVYWWDPNGGAGQYVNYNNLYTPSSGRYVPRFGPGRGYAVSLQASTSYSTSTCAYPFQKPNHNAVCHLYLGWNLIAAPNYHAITWNTTTFRVRRPNPNNNSQVVQGTDGWVSAPYDEPLSQAVAEQAIQDHAFAYGTNQVVTQNPGPGQTNQIQPLTSYWIYAYQELELLIPPA